MKGSENKEGKKDWKELNKEGQCRKKERNHIENIGRNNYVERRGSEKENGSKE